MDYFSFLQKAKSYPLFKIADVLKWFPQADKSTVLNQLSSWGENGRVERIRRGVYKLPDHEIKDSFVLAAFLYSPSYISLESALNSAGIIPDIPFASTCVSLGKTQIFRSDAFGTFLYHHIKQELFFGFETVMSEKNYSYNIAGPEKALFDYFYLKAGKSENKEGFLEEMRLTLPSGFDARKLEQWSKLVSFRNKSFHKLVASFSKIYAK